MVFLDKLFETRNYDFQTKNVQFLRGSSMCKITIQDKLKNNIMCFIISDNAVALSSIDAARVISNTNSNHELELVFEDTNLKDTSNKKKNFIKTILQHGKECEAKQIILITDSITTHSIKEISTSSVGIVHFSFNDINAIQIAKHINQTSQFKKLSNSEAVAFKKENPRYKKELFRFSNFDALIKFYGFNIDDIVFFMDHDSDVGYVPEYGYVYEEL